MNQQKLARDTENKLKPLLETIGLLLNNQEEKLEPSQKETEVLLHSLDLVVQKLHQMEPKDLDQELIIKIKNIKSQTNSQLILIMKVNKDKSSTIGLQKPPKIIVQLPKQKEKVTLKLPQIKKIQDLLLKEKNLLILKVLFKEKKVTKEITGKK